MQATSYEYVPLVLLIIIINLVFPSTSFLISSTFGVVNVLRTINSSSADSEFNINDLPSNYPLNILLKH